MREIKFRAWLKEEIKEAEIIEEDEDLEKSLFGKNSEGNPFED